MCSNFQKAEGVFVNRSVSCLWSPLAPDLRSYPCVAAALSGSLAFCAGSWRGIQIQTAHVALKVRSMKNCRPVVRLQILSGYKKTAPQGTKGFCRGQAAAKWFGVVAERRFIIVKWLIGVRGYYGRGKVSMACLEVWTFSRIHYAGFVESHKNETFPARHPFYSSTASSQYRRETKSPSCCA